MSEITFQDHAGDTNFKDASVREQAYENKAVSFNEERDSYAEKAMTFSANEEDRIEEAPSPPADKDPYKRYPRSPKTTAPDVEEGSEDPDEDLNIPEKNHPASKKKNAIEKPALKEDKKKASKKGLSSNDPPHRLKITEREGSKTDRTRKDQVSPMDRSSRRPSRKMRPLKRRYNDRIGSILRAGRRLQFAKRQALEDTGDEMEEAAEKVNHSMKHAASGLLFTLQTQQQLLTMPLYRLKTDSSGKLLKSGSRAGLKHEKSSNGTSYTESASSSSRSEANTSQAAKEKEKEKEEAACRHHQEDDHRTEQAHQQKVYSRKKKAVQKEEVKQTISLLLPVGLAFIILILLLVVFLIPFFMTLSTIGGSVGEFSSQNSYTTLAMTNEFFTDLMVQFEMFVSPGYEDNYESILTVQHPDIDEFEYELPDEFRYDTVMLKAYLSAKYREYNLTSPEIQEDLQEIFEEYATYRNEIRIENRRIPIVEEDGSITGYEEVSVKICTIYAELGDFEAILRDRMDETQNAQFDRYLASGLGLAVFGPVMEESWGYPGATYRVSSDFGYRIAPREGASTYHGGIDIACPTGTRLYSAVDGTVELSGDSGNGGLRVRIVDANTGIKVVYMHLSSIGVHAGQEIRKGEYIGLSGATGNVTGPHLHLEVHDENGSKHDPRDYIPTHIQ